MSRTIAIGDIHGCSIAFKALIEAINPQSDDTIIPLSDYVDRGIDRIQMAAKTPHSIKAESPVGVLLTLLKSASLT